MNVLGSSLMSYKSQRSNDRLVIWCCLPSIMLDQAHCQLKSNETEMTIASRHHIVSFCSFSTLRFFMTLHEKVAAAIAKLPKAESAHL